MAELSAGPFHLTPDDLRAFLTARDSPAEVLTLDEPTPTVAAAAKVLGVSAGEIVKTLVLMADGEPLLVVAGGTKRVDLDRVQELRGARELRMATPEEVHNATGFPPGGVPPVGHLLPLPLLLDSQLLYKVEVYGGGGDDRSMLRISPLDILRLTGGKAERLSKA